jgi:hypothetical protein
MFGAKTNHKETTPIFALVGHLLGSILYVTEYLGSIGMKVLDRIINLLGGSYGFILQSMNSSSSSMFIFFLMLFIVRAIMGHIFLSYLMHQTFVDSIYGDKSMKILPLYEFDYEPFNWKVRYPNDACENFANSILWWFIFVYIFSLIMVMTKG